MKSSSNKNIIIISIIFVFIISILVFIGILFSKSDEDLFQKYFIQNFDVINQVIDFSSEKEYWNLLNQSSYKETTELEMKYINSQDEEDNYIVNVDGINNVESDVSYKDININFLENNIMNLKYLREQNIYGIRFFKNTKFAAVDSTNNISGILSYFGVKHNIDISKFNIIEWMDLLTFSNEEIQQIEKDYMSIIIQNIEDYSYISEQQNIVLDNNENVEANVYILKLNAENVNLIYKAILNQLCKDELILSKLENIDNKIKEMGITLEKDIKTLFYETIQKNLEEIDYASDMIITVYEANETTIKTTIEYGTNMIEINLNNQNSIKVQYSKNTTDNQLNYTISIKKENNIFELDYEDNNNRFELIRQINVNENDINSDIDFEYTNNDTIKELDINLDKNIEIGETEEIPTSFNNEGKVLLNDYDNKSTTKILNDLKKRFINLMREKRSETHSILLDYIIEFNNKIEDKEKEEEEKKRKAFNRRFELYEGKNLEQSLVLNLIDEAGKNLSNYQVIGNNKIKLYIEEGKVNQVLANEIKEKLNDVNGHSGLDRFNVKINYGKDSKVNEVIIEKIIQGNP